MKDTATGKILHWEQGNHTAWTPAHSPAPEGHTPDPDATLDAIVAALLDGGYDPVVQLSSYFVGNDPTFLPEDTEARTLAHPVGRDKLLEALLQQYVERRRHE